MINKLIESIKKYDSIIIHRHNRPDLDALGSQLGLARSIQSTFPSKRVYVVGDSSNRYAFIGKMDEIEDSVYEGALAIICDVAVSALVSDNRYLLAKEVFVVDHHTNSSDIVGAYTIINSEKAACAEYIAEILYDNEFIVNKECATALFGGIVTDSGRFQYNSTSPNTFLVASKLLASGAEMEWLYNNLYVEDLSSKRMKSYFANAFLVTENNVAYLKNDASVFDKFKVDVFSISRGMVNQMAGIEGINIWCNFTQDIDNNVILGEFRSRGVVIVDIAKKYGGGGHDMACGASLKSWEEVDLILHDFDIRAKEYADGTSITKD